jgi:hypothetical protein
MSDKIRKMMEEMESMKEKLREELAQEEKHINYEIKNGYITFEKEVLEKQKENMKNLLSWFGEIPLLHLLSAPIIYGLIIPAIFLDIILFIYQQVIFRIYKFESIKRSEYVIFDRQYLGYLNVIEKMNCMYCSYFNGLMHYASAIASRTELYFCPIKHAKNIAYGHEYYDLFLSYGNGEKYQENLKKLREDLEK